jgi:hypothetical protein
MGYLSDVPQLRVQPFIGQGTSTSKKATAAAAAAAAAVSRAADDNYNDNDDYDSDTAAGDKQAAAAQQLRQKFKLKGAVQHSAVHISTYCTVCLLCL